MKKDRIRRQPPKKIKDLPVRIQEIIEKILENNDEVAIFGSYSNGTWDEKYSDLDIGIKNFRAGFHPKAYEHMAKYFGIRKIDVRDFYDVIKLPSFLIFNNKNK